VTKTLLTKSWLDGPTKKSSLILRRSTKDFTSGMRNRIKILNFLLKIKKMEMKYLIYLCTW